MPDVLKVGLLPDKGKASMEIRYRPLLSSLSKQLGVLLVRQNNFRLLQYADLTM